MKPAQAIVNKLSTRFYYGNKLFMIPAYLSYTSMYEVNSQLSLAREHNIPEMMIQDSFSLFSWSKLHIP